MSDDFDSRNDLLAQRDQAESEIADLKQQLARAETAQLAWIAIGAKAQADAAWWHATVANYVTSATTEDRALLRDTLAEATTYPHPGAALLTELTAARAVVTAMRKIDKHVIGAYETDTLSVEPCDACGEMREIARQALAAYDAAMPGKAPNVAERARRFNELLGPGPGKETTE